MVSPDTWISMKGKKKVTEWFLRWGWTKELFLYLVTKSNRWEDIFSELSALRTRTRMEVSNSNFEGRKEGRVKRNEEEEGRECEEKKLENETRRTLSFLPQLNGINPSTSSHFFRSLSPIAISMSSSSISWFELTIKTVLEQVSGRRERDSPILPWLTIFSLSILFPIPSRLLSFYSHFPFTWEGKERITTSRIVILKERKSRKIIPPYLILESRRYCFVSFLFRAERAIAHNAHRLFPVRATPFPLPPSVAWYDYSSRNGFLNRRNSREKKTSFTISLAWYEPRQELS